MTELVAGLAMAAISVGYLVWYRTDPDAGYLMIIGALLAVAALGGVVLGATLVGGGGWRLAGLADAGIGRALGAVGGSVLGWLCWPRSRRRRR